MHARRAAAAATLGLAPMAVLGLATPAQSHGTMQTPISRALACYQEGPESPKSAACKAAVAAGGPQALYDWNGIRIGDVAGQHRTRIPDGKLCSAGAPAFKGLDLPRTDWPSTSLKSGAAHTFRFKATAQHKGGFQLFITKNGYNAAKPLKWSDLEAKPFAAKADPPVQGGAYTFGGKLPAGKTGRHLIYAIWQRTDSPEAFYSCSDVVFGQASGTAPAATKPTRTPQPAQPAKECPPTAAAAGHNHHGSGAVNLKSSPAAGSSPDQGGSATGNGLIAGAVGLTLGGVGGLLLTGRRRRDTARDSA